MIIINKNLTNLRLELDNIDNKIAKLILERIDIVKQVGQIKKQEKNNFYVPSREDEIISKISSNYPELSISIIKAVFTEIISACRSYEKIFNIAIQNNYLSRTAAQKIFGSFCNTYIFSDLKEIKLKDTDYIILSLDDYYGELVEINLNFLLLKKISLENVEFCLLEKKRK
ncbi:MAG: chorismate mutase [Fusobacterium sp.]